VLKAGAQQLVSKIQAEKSIENAAAALMLDAEAVAVMQSFNGLAFRAAKERELAQGRLLVDLVQRTLADAGQVNALGRTGLSQLVEHVQQHLQASSHSIETHLRERTNDGAARPLHDNVAGLLRELQACRAQLASVEPPAKASASGHKAARRR